MQNILYESKLEERLNKYFDQNIKLYFICKRYLIIISKNDVFYKLPNDSVGAYAIIALSGDNASIEQYVVKCLCYKSITNFSYGDGQMFAWNVRHEIYCWGLNRFGQLGNDRQDNNFVFVEPEFNRSLSDKLIIDIKCGFEHSLALTEDGNVYAWGWNLNGQVGNNSKFQVTPFKVEGFDDEKVVEISCGSYSSMALTEAGLVFGWGENACGSLGFKIASDVYFPQRIIITNINQTNVLINKIMCGKTHNLFLSKLGDLYSFGNNQFGQVGNGTDETQFTPILLKIDNKKFREIFTHNQYDISIALSEDGIYHIWGKYSKDVKIRTPEETNFQSFNDILLTLFGITHKPLEGKLVLNSSIISNGKYSKHFDELGVIGEGSYGCVYKVKLKSDDNLLDNLSAIKCVKLKIEEKSEFLREFQISYFSESKLLNKYCVRFHAVWLEENKILSSLQSELILFIQMDLCDMTLTDVIHLVKSDSSLSNEQLLSEIGYYITCELFFELLEGVEYLHKQNPPLIHRDLKPGNILIKKKRDGRFVRIADFGLVTNQEFAGKSHDMDKGTLEFMAPEIETSAIYDTRADVYSLGIIMKHMFHLIDVDSKILDVNSKLYWKYKNAMLISENMSADSPEDRPDCTQIIANNILWHLHGKDLQHKYLADYFKFSKNYFNYIIETKLMNSIGVGKYLINVLNFKINNFTLLSLTHLKFRIESIFDLLSEEIIDISNTFYDLFVLTKSGRVYSWYREFPTNDDKIIIREFVKLELDSTLISISPIKIKCGKFHAIALTKSGEVYSWETASPFWLKVTGFNEEKIISISCGHNSSIALTEEGDVYSWGIDDYGQLGHSSGNDKYHYSGEYRVSIDNEQLKPKKIEMAGIKFTKICCGSRHTLILSNDGDIYVFGNNNRVQLGSFLSAANAPPFKLNTSVKFKDVAAHPFHSFSIALSENSVYYIWGIYDKKCYYKPTKTDFTSFDEIYAKYFIRNKITNKENIINR